MKHVLPALIVALCLSACVTPAPTPPQPPAPPGLYEIVEIDAQGRPGRSWTVNTFTESGIPPRVTFTHDGRTVTLEGSYQIDEYLR